MEQPNRFPFELKPGHWIATDTDYSFTMPLTMSSISTEGSLNSTAVMNPYALAEVVSGRRINWQEVKNSPELIASILQTPWEELFDPKFSGPLYFGFKLDDELRLVPTRCPLLDVEIAVAANDLETPLDSIDMIRKLADLGPRYRVDNVGPIPVVHAEVVGNQIRLTVRLPSHELQQRLAQVFPKSVLAKVAPDPATVGKSQDWTPPNATWGDKGRFFNETAEFFDPIQGAVGNCYFIAALSAVAWAMPSRIRHLTRATGQPQDAFTNIIQFFKPDSVLATAQLTGGHREYHTTARNTADQLWKIVRQNSRGHRTFNPMTAWTYPTGDAAPKKVVYANANVVASHACTILGWDYRNGRKYIILRNPWGNTQATVQNLTGTTWLWDISWWRPVNLADMDGTFAVEASAFQQYWQGLGVVK